MYETFPMESNLQDFFHDNFNAEVVAGVIENKQDVVDYLTWKHIVASKCIEIEDEMDLSALNLGMIASYYCISYTTIERFSSLLSSKTKTKGLLEILTSASEYDMIPIRPGEEERVQRLINHQRFSFENPNWTDPLVRLVQAMVDVISKNGWLNLALLAMEASKMVTQGMWERDSTLLQLPHFTKKRCQEKNIETVFDLVEMEDEERQELLMMEDTQLPKHRPYYEVVGGEEVTTGKEVTLQVMLERDMEGRTEVGAVDALRYPKKKEEGWWLVVGDTKTNQLVAIKRVSLQKKAKLKQERSHTHCT
ncbi:LOW QUALITY PROTEIN: hypothetical protein BRARA_F01498 [Brassica rapa]|nr:LOW QUALITY PROTEIN: hypothetical protein BRARA_F01498 [Brassica rapa]